MGDAAGWRVIARLRRLWLTWRAVALLSLLCLVLATLNVWQLYRALTAPLRGENKALASALDRITGLAAARDRDDAQLLDRLAEIAARGERVRTVYRSAAAADPLAPQCAPGQARIDAVNAGLGPEEGKP